jgi:5-methylphenazine-1-carboxylate 1-monooxygenase
MEIAIIGGGIAGPALALNCPPDFINIRVEELTGDRPFGDLDDFISQEELRALSDRYKRIAGYSIEQLGTPGPAPAK